jgi:sortase (surface protein transpeptidase)
MTSPIRGRRRSQLASAAVALLLLTGCASAAQTEAAVAPSPAATAATAPEPSTAASTETEAAPVVETPAPAQLPVLEASTPVSVTIPSIGAQTHLLRLGLQENGSLEVPPGDPGAPASWYTHSPTPGERGPAVLLGHVNSYGGGPGVFAQLRELKTGDTIEVTREDGTTAVFVFDRGEQYAKNAFPTQSVYGNTEGSELRLITCDGYDPATGEFDDNYVVYAKLLA